MIPKQIALSIGMALKCYGKQGESEIVRYAKPISEYIPFEATSTKAGTTNNWEIDEDIEVVNAWFSVVTPDNNPVNLEETIKVEAVEKGQTVIGLQKTFAELEISGPVGYWELPKGTLLRKGWELVVTIGSPTKGFRIICENCHIYNSVQSRVVG